MPIAKGAQVRQVVPVIQGQVLERRFNDDANTMEYHVSYVGADGPTARWFKESELEVVPTEGEQA